MKKIRVIMIAVICFYFASAMGLCWYYSGFKGKQNNSYRVSIERIKNRIEGDQSFIPSSDESIEIPKSFYEKEEQIARVLFLGEEQKDEKCKQEFYEPLNGYQYEITPLTEEGTTTGYLRFDYKKKQMDNSLLMVLLLSLTLFTLIILFLLGYLQKAIVKPFCMMSEIPGQLAKGNTNLMIKESKDHYFGRFIWGIGMLKDTLELHKKRELELTREKKMLILSISHDIKTPLNAMVLYAKGLEEGLYLSEKEQKKVAVKIQEKAEEINGFVQEIVKSAKEDLFVIDVHAEDEFYLKQLCEKIRGGYEEKCQIRHMNFIMEPCDNVLLKGDIDRMYEVVGNLIENAFKYGDGIELRISFSEEEYCQLIHVDNSGVPVEESEMPHLMESFFRGKNTVGKQGNGLGLYICKEIMQKMNGELYAVRHERGMEFVLVCPMG